MTAAGPSDRPAWRRAATAAQAWARRVGAPTLLLAGAAAALVAGLLPWQWPVQRDRFDHVVVLDITQSMGVADMVLDGRPASRLAYAKRALRQALDTLPCGSRIGWGVFTEYRTLLLLAPVEVCDGLAELRDTLDAIDFKMAWVGGSEVAKGLHSGLAVAEALPDHPSLVFVTDGHEAPPLHPRHRPRLDGKPGEVPGLLVGVGQPMPSPIPKRDPQGRVIGRWDADEVLQADPRSRGRSGSVLGETLADDAAGPPLAIGATPGTEHLSGLRETYLRLLASEDGLRFVRLDDAGVLADALRDAAFARPVPVGLPAHDAMAAVALLLVLARLGLSLRRRR